MSVRRPAEDGAAGHRKWARRAESFAVGRSNGVMMTSVERYRRYAAECARLSKQATTLRDKALFLQMAEYWIGISERAEAREDTDGSKEEKK
jgi:hypothetical protein